MLEAEVETFLPDDIVIDLLRRLPSKDVFRFKCVCRRWRDIISTEDFVHLNMQSGLGCSLPMILVEGRGKHRNRQIFIDGWWSAAEKKWSIHNLHSYPNCTAIFSLEGFLVLRSEDSGEIIIANPAHGEKVRIIPPKNLIWSTGVYGMFFNRTLNEYCLLLGVKVLPDEFFMPSIEYKILNLGPNPCIRQISTPWNSKLRFHLGHPIVINEHIYWLVDPEGDLILISHADIVEFDTKTERFTLLRYPVVKTSKRDDFGLDLLEIDGFLSVVRIARGKMVVEVTVWNLRDRAKELWTSSKYCFTWEVYPMSGILKALVYNDGELVIQSGQKLLVCNIRTGSVRSFGKKFNMDVSSFSHVVSHASLRNCKSKIFMEGDDEEDKKSEVYGLS